MTTDNNIFNITPRPTLLRDVLTNPAIDLGITDAGVAPSTYTLTLDTAEYAMLGGLITETLRQIHRDVKTMGEDGHYYVSLPTALVSIHNKLADLAGTDAISEGDAA
jgi:hypothetical protein